jgi:hypothetical protein
MKTYYTKETIEKILEKTMFCKKEIFEMLEKGWKIFSEDKIYNENTKKLYRGNLKAEKNGKIFDLAVLVQTQKNIPARWKTL